MCLCDRTLGIFPISVRAGEIVQDGETVSILVQFKNRAEIIAAAESRYSIKQTVRCFYNGRGQIPGVVMIAAEAIK